MACGRGVGREGGNRVDRMHRYRSTDQMYTDMLIQRCLNVDIGVIPCWRRRGLVGRRVRLGGKGARPDHTPPSEIPTHRGTRQQGGLHNT